jgi:hypothetical protein
MVTAREQVAYFPVTNPVQLDASSLVHRRHMNDTSLEVTLDARTVCCGSNDMP